MEYNLYAVIIKTFTAQPRLTIESLSSLIHQNPHKTAGLVKQLIGFGCLKMSDQKNELMLLKKIDLYCQGKISQDVLPECSRQGLVLTLFVETDSTNTYLKLLPPVNDVVQVCLTEQQTKGRGRRGKVWFSPFAENIYMSLRKKIHISPMHSGGLSLVVGLAVVKAINKLGCTGLQVKWPNDVYFQGKKISGVLIEVVAIKPDSIEVVVGVGVNVMMTSELSCEIDQQWTDLFHALQNSSQKNLPTRNVIVASLINEICLNLSLFEKHGLDGFQADWLSHDFLLGKNITIQTETENSFGKAIGINSLGELLMQNADGVTNVNAGEVSVRLMTEGKESL